MEGTLHGCFFPFKKKTHNSIILTKKSLLVFWKPHLYFALMDIIAKVAQVQ